MKTATVYYTRLTELQVAAVNNPNGKGWATPCGLNYLNAKDGRLNDPKALAMFEKAATVTLPDLDSESVWSMLQNGREPWTATPGITCHTDFPRSMDVGDLILWDNGRVSRCASIGFEHVGGEMLAAVRHHLTTTAMEG